MDNSKLAAFPEIRTQGSLGSCTTFAITYYQLTYTAARLYGAGKKDSSDNTWKFSPKWTYNMINGGKNEGSWPGDAYHLLEQHGAARWSLFPYQTSATDPKSYREWCRDGETWRDAISYRIYPHLYCTPATTPPTSEDIDNWLVNIKTMLAGGEVLTFVTYVHSWQFTSIKDDKSTAEDDAFVRKPVAYWVKGMEGGHVMTIVGYNDSIWTDINNNRVVDLGEKGALKIANSWGPNWADSGFCWLAYDALRSQSAVAGVPSSGTRTPAIWYPNLGYGVFSINVMPDYRPTLLAKFKLKHAKRDQLGVALATFDGETRTPWPPGALQIQGGPYAFDGTSVACEGTFVFDFTDILPEDYFDFDYSYELWVADSKTGDPAELLGYKLIDVSQAQPTASGGLLNPSLVWDYPDSLPIPIPSLPYPYPSDLDSRPQAVASADPASGRVPLTVKFDGVGSSGDIYAYVWDFGDGSSPVQVQPPSIIPHTYSTVGTYAATLTVLDRGWAESSDQVVVTVTRKK